MTKTDHVWLVKVRKYVPVYSGNLKSASRVLVTSDPMVCQRCGKPPKDAGLSCGQSDRTGGKQ